MKFVDKIEKGKDLIGEAISKYGRNNIQFASSYGKDSIVALHLSLQVDPAVKVFSLVADTEFLETLHYIEELNRLWNLQVKTYTFKQGDLVKKRPEECCRTRKVEAMKEALKGVECWISGVRRTEGTTRKEWEYIETRQGIVKINPILDFTELDIWRYIALHQLPVNPLYKKGYRSLGCKYCSFKETDEADGERDGRWQGTENAGGECGIHLINFKK